jgi:hypothetical protein
MTTLDLLFSSSSLNAGSVSSHVAWAAWSFPNIFWHFPLYSLISSVPTLTISHKVYFRNFHKLFILLSNYLPLWPCLPMPWDERSFFGNEITTSLMKIFELALQSKPAWMRLKVGRFSAESCFVWKSKSLQSQT